MTLLRYGLLLSAAVLLIGAGGTAGKSKAGKADFWSELARPGHKRFLAAMARGKAIWPAYTSEALPTVVERALAEFRKATVASPKAPEGHFAVGRALYHLGRFKECVASFKRVRKHDPLYPKDRLVAFWLGIAYSKLAKFELAVREYGRADRLAIRQGLSRGLPFRAMVNANAAEALMALGRLDEAIQRYREAKELGPSSPLTWWGLAVALDRDEQVSKARAALQHVLRLDPEMKNLKQPTVFFIPPGDVHYYYAMGHLGAGKTNLAKKEFETFLKKLPKSPWAARAREHLAQLGQRWTGASRQKRRLAPSPRDGPSVGSSARDRAAVRVKVNQVSAKLRACYRKELRRDKNLTGRMRVAFVVAKSGLVTKAQLLGGTLRKASLSACVLRTFRAIRFSPLRGGRAIKMIYPLEFKPR